MGTLINCVMTAGVFFGIGLLILLATVVEQNVNGKLRGIKNDTP